MSAPNIILRLCFNSAPIQLFVWKMLYMAILRQSENASTFWQKKNPFIRVLQKKIFKAIGKDKPLDEKERLF